MQSNFLSASTITAAFCFLFKAKTVKGATVPKPFNLSTGNKRKVEESESYVPMAERIEQFQKRTPDRYHLRSRRSQERGVLHLFPLIHQEICFILCRMKLNCFVIALLGPSPVKADHLKLTRPHTPRLMTRQRSRPPAVKSSAEMEAEEVDKLHK